MSFGIRRPGRYFTSNNDTTNSAPPTCTVDVSSINKVFDKYRKPSDPQDTMTYFGILAFVEALGMVPEDPTVLALWSALKAETLSQITRTEFIEGWKRLGCDTIEKMRAKIPELRNTMANDEAIFKQVYKDTFKLVMPSSAQKSLAEETAVAYWKLLLVNRWKNHWEAWFEFLEDVNHGRSIARDPWNQAYEFMLLCNNDPEFKTYDPMGSWPSLMDGFVEYYQMGGRKGFLARKNAKK